MTALAPAPPEPRTRRVRTGWLVAAGLLAAVLVVVLFGGDGLRTGTPLDPDNPDPDGAQGLARVLDDQGVAVDVVRSAAALDRTPVGPDTTVLVTSTNRLGVSTIDRLLAHAGGARIVLVDPGPGTTRALGVTGQPFRVALNQARDGRCPDPSYGGLSLEVDRALEYPGPGGCFAGDHGSLLVQPRPGLVLFGAGQALTNGQILRADDAAVALRLLGQHPRLVWYVPSLDDLSAGDGVSVASLLPRWLRPALWLVAIAVVALLLWRARRLGPLSVEPLPVTVRAIETTHSRGRLYRRAGDRAHAADALRRAARRRAATRLRLGRHPDPATLVHDVARHVGRPVEQVDRLIGPAAPPPGTDHDLIALATALAELDREVRRT